MVISVGSNLAGLDLLNLIHINGSQNLKRLKKLHMVKHVMDTYK